MEKLKKYILSQVAGKNLSVEQGKEMLRELSEADQKAVDTDVAIIGMSGKFSSTESIQEFWGVIKDKKNTIRNFPEGRASDLEKFLENKFYGEFMGISSHRPKNVKEILSQGGYLTEVDKFDSYFFNISPSEAINMDPYQRISLETSWLAIEDAGYDPDSYKGKNVGVFLGRDMTNLSYYKQSSEPNQMLLTGTWESLTASRISYFFDFKGPSMVIDTACSSGLASVHMAIQSMMTGECETAIAGGINLSLFGELKSKYIYGANLENVESYDSRVKTFDANANGTLWSEGVGLVLLKPLKKAIADGDNIQAVIKASALNNDGASNSITAPNAKTQEELLVTAWKKANIDVESIGFIETHGTGTVLGDPIEVKGLTNAFRQFTKKKQFCAIGSSKTNFGHMVAASGIASLVKVVKALQDKVLPPNLNFEIPNPYINFIESPLYVNNTMNEWKSEGTRRAGVSSFGFSRTNCHVLVEEAPNHAVTKGSSPFYFLTISAKNEVALNDYLLSYRDFMENTNLPLEDICYTANRGRGHYQYRAIFMSNDKNNLIKNINLAIGKKVSNEFKTGSYQIVGNHKSDLVEGELTIVDKETLDKELLSVMSQYDEIHKRNAAFADKVMELYAKGADINWGIYFNTEERTKVSIPTYPLQRIRYWANLKESMLPMAIDTRHSLVQKKVNESEDFIQFETIVNSDENWELQDHKINGICVLPGTAYLEMLHYITSNVLNMKDIILEDLFFLNPLVVSEENKVLIITVSDIKRKPHFSIYSKDDEGKEVYHMEGNVGRQSNVVIPEKINLKQMLDGLKEEIFDNSTLDDEQVFSFGKHWRIIHSIWEGKEYTIGKIQLHDEFIDEIKEYKMHPSIMDNCVNLISQINGKTYLPFSYKKLIVHRNLTEKVYTVIKPLYDKDKTGETITFDILITDEYGNVLIEILKYVIKQVHKINNLTISKEQYVSLKWVVDSRETNYDVVAKLEKWVIVGFSGESFQIAEAEFKKSGIQTISFFIEEEKIFDSEKEAKRLIDCIQQNKADGLVLLTDYTSKDIDYTDSNEVAYYKSVLLDMQFHLIKYFVNKKILLEGGIKVVLREAHSVDGTEVNLNPLGAAVSAQSLVIGKEYHNIPVDIVDVDSNAKPIDFVPVLIASKGKGLISLRKGVSYVRELNYCSQPHTDYVNFERSGVYIITGGLGGLGFEIAQYLQTFSDTKLILIGRQDIYSSDTNPSKFSKLEKMRILKEKSEYVEYIAADISDIDTILRLKKEVTEKYGTISGIYHAAGVAGDGFIMNKDYNKYISVIMPKILGAVNLLSLIPENSESFFLLFSSINALTCEEGQSDYSAANAFLDSLSYKGREWGKKILSINWSGWKNVGMLKDYNLNEDDSLFTAIDVTRGIEYMDEFINQESAPKNPVIPARINYSVLMKSMDALPFEISSSIKARLNAGTTKGGNDSNMEDVEIKGTAEIDNILRTLSNIFGNVLGLSEINVTLSFQELGGNSLMATQLLRIIEKHLDSNIDISDVFSYPSVISLAGYVREKEQKVAKTEEEDELQGELLDYLMNEIDDKNLLVEANLLS